MRITSAIARHTKKWNGFILSVRPNTIKAMTAMSQINSKALINDSFSI